MARFAGVGASGVLVNILVFRLALLVFRHHPSIANAMAVEVSIVWNYGFNAIYTFRQPWSLRAAAQYNLVSLGGAIVQIGAFTGLLGYGLGRMWADVLAIPLGTGLTFLFSWVWVFRTKGANQDGSSTAGFWQRVRLPRRSRSGG